MNLDHVSLAHLLNLHWCIHVWACRLSLGWHHWVAFHCLFHQQLKNGDMLPVPHLCHFQVYIVHILEWGMGRAWGWLPRMSRHSVWRLVVFRSLPLKTGSLSITFWKPTSLGMYMLRPTPRVFQTSTAAQSQMGCHSLWPPSRAPAAIFISPRDAFLHHFMRMGQPGVMPGIQVLTDEKECMGRRRQDLTLLVILNTFTGVLFPTPG